MIYCTCNIFVTRIIDEIEPNNTVYVDAQGNYDFVCNITNITEL